MASPTSAESAFVSDSEGEEWDEEDKHARLYLDRLMLAGVMESFPSDKDTFPTEPSKDDVGSTPKKDIGKSQVLTSPILSTWEAGCLSSSEDDGWPPSNVEDTSHTGTGNNPKTSAGFESAKSQEDDEHLEISSSESQNLSHSPTQDHPYSKTLRRRKMTAESSVPGTLVQRMKSCSKTQRSSRQTQQRKEVQAHTLKGNGKHVRPRIIKDNMTPSCSGICKTTPTTALNGKAMARPKSLPPSGKLLTLQAVKRRNRFGECLLHKAVLEGDNVLLKDILKLRPDVNISDNNGCTPLHEAVLRGLYNVTLDLIKAGALVNTAAYNGVTALYNAIRCWHKKIAKILLKHGANPLLKDMNGETACDINTDQFLQQLMEKNISGISAISASKREYMYHTRSKVHPSQSLDSSTHQSGTSEDPNKHRATYKNKILSEDTVKRKNTIGETFLHIAAREGNTLMVHQILELGANVNVADNAGWTALHEAVLNGHYEACVDLIKAGAVVNAVAYNGVTPLHDAIRHGHKKVAEVLLRHGAEPMLNDVGEDTAAATILQEVMEENVTKNKRENLPALKHTESVAMPSQGTTVTERASVMEEPELHETGKLQASPGSERVSSADMVIHGNQRKSSTSPNDVKVTTEEVQQYSTSMHLKNSCSLLQEVTPSVQEGLNQSHHPANKVIKHSSSGRRHILDLLLQGESFDLDAALAAHMGTSETTFVTSNLHKSHNNSEMSLEPKTTNCSNDVCQPTSGYEECNISSTPPAENTDECSVSLLQPHADLPTFATSFINFPEKIKQNSTIESLDSCKSSSPSLLAGVDLLMRNGITSAKPNYSEITEAVSDFERPESKTPGPNKVSDEGKTLGSNFIHGYSLAFHRSCEFSETNFDTFITQPLGTETQGLVPKMYYALATISGKISSPLVPLYSRDQTTRSTDMTDTVSVSLSVTPGYNEDSATVIDPATPTNLHNDPPCSPDSDCTLITELDHRESQHCAKRDETIKRSLISEPLLGIVGDHIKSPIITDHQSLQDQDNVLEVTESCNEEWDRDRNLTTAVDKSVSLLRDPAACQSRCDFTSQGGKKEQKTNMEMKLKLLKPPDPLTASPTSCADNASESANLSQGVRARKRKKYFNSRNPFGEEHLHTACKRGDLVGNKALIQAGVNVNMKDNAGWAALHQAYGDGSEAVFEELLKAGADVNFAGLQGVTSRQDVASSRLSQMDCKLRSECKIVPGNKSSEAHHWSRLSCQVSFSLSHSDTEEVQSRESGDKGRAREPSDIQPALKDTTIDNLNPSELSTVLQDMERKQAEMSTWPPTGPEDAGKFLAALTQIQSVLSYVLAKQHLEKDNLTHKYRSVQDLFSSFLSKRDWIATDFRQQGSLRTKLILLASRQRKLVQTLRKQMDLEGVYLTGKANISSQPCYSQVSPAGGQLPDTPSSTSAFTPALSKGRQQQMGFSERCNQANEMKKNRKPLIQANVLKSKPQTNAKDRMVPKPPAAIPNQLKNCPTQTDVLNKKRSICQSSTPQPVITSKDINLQMKGNNALIQTRTQDISRDLCKLIQRGIVPPGSVLHMLWKGHWHLAHVLADGSMKDSKGKLHLAPEDWLESILGNNIPVSSEYAWNKVMFREKPLSNYLLNMDAEGNTPQSNPEENFLHCSSAHGAVTTVSPGLTLMNIKTIRLVRDEDFLPNSVVDCYWEKLLQSVDVEAEDWCLN